MTDAGAFWSGLLGRLGDDTGVEGVRLDETGRLGLTFDDQAVDFEAGDRGLTVLATAGTVPGFAREETFAAMLAANYPEGRLGGSWLCLDGSGENVLLVRRFAAGVDYGAFRQGLEEFLAGLTEWKERLAH